jgi:autotransporter-associated beta strand protein
LAGDQVVFRMQTNNFNAFRTERNNSPPFAGAFNNGTNEVGLFANNGSFNNTPGAAGFQTFTTTGNGNTGTARPLQVGDTFTITAFSSTNPSAGGRMGISFRDSTNYTDFFSSTDADTEIRLQLDSSGNWKVYEGGTERMTSSSGAGADRTLVVKITSSTTFDAQIGGTWYYNFTMGAGGGLVDSFALYTFGDSNPDIYWKNGLLEDSGTVELGYALGSASSRAYAGNVFTPGVITDGLAATSNVTVRTNSVFVGGDSGSQVNLANSNSFSGALTVNANATLEAQHAHALGATNAGTTVTAGGALKLFSPSGISYATESLVLSGTGLGGTNGALRSVGGNNTWNGAITLGSNVRINADTTGGAGSLSIAGAIDGGNNTLFLGADGAAIGISGAITGAGATNSGVLTSVYKDGASTLTLSGVNAFSGAVRVATGTLLVGSSAALGTTAGATTVDSGAVFAMSNNITISENLTINGTGVSAGGVLRNLSGDNTHNGTLSLGSASRVSSDAGTLTLGGTVSGSNVGLTVGGAGNTAIQTAVGIGSGRLTKEDAGTLTLSAANDYTGGTLISGGRLVGDTRSLQGAITNNAALTFAQATNGTYAGLVSGTGSVVKTNSGAVTFSGANSYSGGTLVAGGTLIGDTRSLQGTITNTAAVTFSQTTNGSYTGLMSGSGGTLTKSGIGTVTLTANNAYTGATTVGAGRLIVNGSQGSSAVTVSNGASLGGSGTVGALTVSGLLAPGNSIGTLSAGNTVFNGGGSFELEMFDWVNSAGTGWDLLAITGNLTLSNTSGSPFTINLVSLQNSSTPGLSTDWNQDVNFTNTFVTYTGTLGGTAFNANLFTVNTNGFQNPFSGTFSITNVSGGLALLYTSAFVPSSTYTWNAGSGLWGTTGNWTNGAAPTNGASIIFAGAAGGSSTNSSTVSSIQGLVFSNTAGSYTVSGSALAVGVDGISNASTSAQTISNNLSFAANAAITAGAGNLTLAGNLTNGGNAVTVGGGSNTTISGTVSGSGALSKLGSGTLLLGGANNFTGATTIAGGTVVANNASSLGATNAGTTVADGASLHFSGGVTSAESITIAGNGLGGGGAIRSLGDGENTLTGTITLSGNARINVDAPIGSVTTLSSLGSGAFTIVDSFNTTFTQSLTNLTVTSAILGGTVAGEFASDTNWSSVSTFGLRMSTTKNPGVFVEAAFYDSIPELLRTYQTSTDGLMGVPSVMILSFVDGTSSLSNVRYLQFKLNDDFSSPENLSFIDLVSVPTSGLIISGNVNAGANVLTVGSASGAAGTVADGVRLTGVISGSGNTFSSTTTSLVKDGGGTVYLSGNNTFTGDARVLDGVLDVVFGASTNALGTGSDLFISSLGTLSLSGSVSTSSLQGAGTGDAGNVVLANKSVLTVNGAGKTMTMAGSISGSGAIRLDGNSSTVLTLTGDNTFDNGVSTAVTVAAGTLVLAGTEGNQALRLAGRIAVGASGKLLLQSSDQVRDNSIISLSGGTIQRAGGVSEVFGNLNLTTASFIDYGTGATGTLRFGTYTPSSLLTVQNFLPGNKLQFGSTLTEGELNNPTLFAFSNGFTTGTEGGFFTITAIPEPSTYLAAAGLLALFLWPVRRRLITDAKSILGLRPASHVRIDS